MSDPEAASLRIAGVLETAVYVDDVRRAHGFYGEVLGLERILTADRLWAYAVAPGEVLLVCPREAAQEDAPGPGGACVPGHRADGPAHMAFRIDAEAYAGWKARLSAAGFPVVSEVTWPKGGRSFYVRDPDGNVIEFATPGIWANY